MFPIRRIIIIKPDHQIIKEITPKNKIQLLLLTLYQTRLLLPHSNRNNSIQMLNMCPVVFTNGIHVCASILLLLLFSFFVVRFQIKFLKNYYCYYRLARALLIDESYEITMCEGFERKLRNTVLFKNFISCYSNQHFNHRKSQEVRVVRQIMDPDVTAISNVPTSNAYRIIFNLD